MLRTCLAISSPASSTTCVPGQWGHSECPEHEHAASIDMSEFSHTLGSHLEFVGGCYENRLYSIHV